MSDNLLSAKTDGVFIISATPFSESGKIDFESLDRLLEFYVEKGVSGITILGMMGEAQKLSSEETSHFVRHTMNRLNGRIPVVVGVSNAGLDNLVHLAEESMQAGAAGIMVAPFSALNTDEKIYDYYGRLFQMIDPKTPVCYQDFPLGTNAPVSVPCLERLFSDFSQLVMLKHEDWPGLSKITRLRERQVSGSMPEISILVGNGGLYLPQELARGSDGAMTGFAYPEMLVSVVSLFRSGEQEKAEDLFDAYLPLVRYEQQPGFGLAVRKEILRRRGVIRCERTRAPGPALSETDHKELDHLIKRVENYVKGLEN